MLNPVAARSKASKTVRLLELRVRVPLWAWISVICECCVLSDADLSRRAGHSSGEVLPSVVCLRVVVKHRH